MNNEGKILTFLLKDEYYAADIMEIERILGYEVLTTLPEAPRYIMGLMKYEETVLPVISLRRKFNFEDEADNNNSKIIVVKKNGYRVGILVDQVTEVRNIDKNKIEMPMYISSAISSRYIKGVIKEENEIIILLSLDEILSSNDKELLEQGI